MRTFIEIMRWVGGMVAVFGFANAFGMIIADGLYRTTLGENTYLDLNVIGLWDVSAIFVVGVALVITFEILNVVFKAGERSTTQEE